MKKLAEQGSWIVTVPLILANVAYLYFFFLPGKQEVEAMRDDIASTQAYLATAASRPMEIEHTLQKLDQAKAFTDQWQRSAPRTERVSQYFGEINRRAGAASVAVTRFEPREIEEMEHLDRISLYLGTEGTFEQTFQLLKQLEQLPGTVWVDSLRFRSRRAPRGLPNSVVRDAANASVQSEINLAIFAAKTKDSN